MKEKNYDAIIRKIDIPEGVTVNVVEKLVSVKGPKGDLAREFSDPRYSEFVTIVKDGNVITITSSGGRRKNMAIVGTISSLIKNMIVGVEKGFRYNMKIHYVHFPITIEVKGKEVIIKNFLGARGVRRAKIIGAAKIDVKKDVITIEGIDKGTVSQTAANIEKACKISGLDRRTFLDGIYMVGHEVMS
ncbi:MAG: 50S ribosomal protein L6 [Candidatus Aenigmatarchaeota archaeon]